MRNDRDYGMQDSAHGEQDRISKLFGPEDADYQAFLAQRAVSAHPERFTLGKAHPDRARQFKPFAALRGYEELVAEVIAKANEPHDFTPSEESC